MVDEEADYCFCLCRMVGHEDDTGMITVMVLDQLTAEAQKVSVILRPDGIQAMLPAETALELGCDQEFKISFREPLANLGEVRAALQTVFTGLRGFVDETC
jgi:hypothetical protein